jgi:hypothetical protein
MEDSAHKNVHDDLDELQQLCDPLNANDSPDKKKKRKRNKKKKNQQD